MAPFTGFLYACLIFYGAGWYMGKWSGNFSLLLFVLTVVTLGYWIAERWVFLPRRLAAAAALGEQDASRRAELDKLGITQVDGDIEEARHKVL
ncbi:MAG: hypothetical protein RLY71_3730, partial [Pseudomonadota bacterium]